MPSKRAGSYGAAGGAEKAVNVKPVALRRSVTVSVSFCSNIVFISVTSSIPYLTTSYDHTLYSTVNRVINEANSSLAISKKILVHVLIVINLTA